jgi:hypothetical protein
MRAPVSAIEIGSALVETGPLDAIATFTTIDAMRLFVAPKVHRVDSILQKLFVISFSPGKPPILMFDALGARIHCTYDPILANTSFGSYGLRLFISWLPQLWKLL